MVAALACAACAVAAGADPPQEANHGRVAAGSFETRRVVEVAAAQVLEVLRDREAPVAQKSHRASAIVEDNIDFPTFARLALGPAWNEMTDAQRGQFLAEFHKLVRSIFIEGIDQYNGQDVVVTDERQESRGDRVVRMRIIDTRSGKRRDVAGVDFRLRESDGRWKAIDLNIAGISIAVACRAQFAVFLRDGGVTRVIEVLKEKNARRDRKEASGHGE